MGARTFEQYVKDKLAEKGVDNEEIRQQTGWFKGVDGKWRFEISDADAKLDKVALELLQDTEHEYDITLGELLEHENLYEAYPELADVKVVATTKQNLGGSYNPDTNTIKINPNHENLKSVLMHEVQHWIQRKEGFARGGNFAKTYRELDYQDTDIQKSVRMILGAAYDYVSDKEIKKVIPYLKEAYVTNDMSSDTEQKYIKWFKDNSIDEDVFLINDFAVAQAKYERLYGETEARNTQARMDMTDAERKATTPESTQDVANADAIVVFDDGTVAAYMSKAVKGNENALTERENGPKIADDDALVEVTKIDSSKIPVFDTKVELREWLITEFEKLGEATINSTNQKVIFNDDVARRVIKNARNRKNNLAYPEIEKVVANAKYSGFREADANHKKVIGQDVYHSAIVVGTKPYSVEFYVDIPKYKSGKSEFAGNKIKEIKIAPADTQVTSDKQNGLTQAYEAIHNISLAVLRGKVKPKNYNISDKTLTQKAKQGVKGSFTPSKNLIQLFKDADASTLPHEFAHYWLNNMWNYVRSGAASEKYQNRWGIVADWLGIKPTQTRIYRAQQEQFARGYEAYLWRGELPNPIIKGAFDDYDKWLREVYKDINELNVELTDDAIRFFQSMTTGELPEPNVRAKPAEVKAETQETKPESTTPTQETNEVDSSPVAQNDSDGRRSAREEVLRSAQDDSVNYNIFPI